MFNKIRNPILPGFHPDPSICRVGEDYFLVNSSFAYFPGVPVFHSRDLVHWRQIGHCLTRPSQLPLAHSGVSGGIFAPTIRYHDGIFYMVTTNVTGGGNFFVTTPDPSGEWSEPVWLAQDGIDPSLLFDEGHVYLTNSGMSGDPQQKSLGIIQSEIDVASGKLLTRPRPLWYGTGGSYPEGPHLYRIGEYYYLMIAEGGTEYGHTETIARSRSPWGPWESCPQTPILTHRSSTEPIQGTGHADLVEAHDGSWWMVCLGFRPVFPQAHYLGRETFLSPVIWDAQGWPHVGLEGRIKLEMESPHLAPVTWPAAPVRDDFDEPGLALKWNFLGIPAPGDWSLQRRAGALCLQGKPARLDEGLGVAFVGCRQEHFNCEVSTSVDFSPTKEGEEAGLTAWMDPRHHYEVFITLMNGKRMVCVRRRIGSLVATLAQEELASGPVTLLVHANRLLYTFGCHVGSGAERILATGETHYLSSEVAGGFTGVYFGLYASGNGSESSAPACFDWFDYCNNEQPGILTVESTLAQLLNEKGSKDILEKHAPALLAYSQPGWMGNMSLLDLFAMSPDEFHPAKLFEIDSELRKAGLPLRAA